MLPSAAKRVEAVRSHARPGGHEQPYDSSRAGTPGFNSDLRAEALLGILSLRARTAAPHSMRIRAGLRLARLSGAKAFTENRPGKKVGRLRRASRDFEQIANSKPNN